MGFLKYAGQNERKDAHTQTEVFNSDVIGRTYYRAEELHKAADRAGEREEALKEAEHVVAENSP